MRRVYRCKNTIAVCFFCLFFFCLNRNLLYWINVREFCMCGLCCLFFFCVFFFLLTIVSQPVGPSRSKNFTQKPTAAFTGSIVVGPLNEDSSTTALCPVSLLLRHEHARLDIQHCYSASCFSGLNPYMPLKVTFVSSD